ncbi:DUF2953 domain-containing protein [Clostridium chrysemydis]|uniref:DUF2953 domain-containing protein n=1 Tax=Clostridium chrysemydis TaxID=2665504 RepID=UPI0018847A07
MTLFFILLILFILFLKIPIKLKVSITKNEKKVLFFNRNLLKKTSKDRKKKYLRQKFNFSRSKVFLNDFLSSINQMKSKPQVKITGYINYSLGDPWYTAISYGLFSTFAAFLFKFSKIFFNYKKSNLIINPLLEKKMNYALKFECIIYISLVQIIHITILFVLSYFKSKEVSLFGELYE